VHRLVRLFPPTSVVATQIGHLRLEAAIGGYDAAAQAQQQLDAVYTFEFYNTENTTLRT
jgi:hypothetical protein